MFRPDDPFLITNPLEIEQWLNQIVTLQTLVQIADRQGRAGFLTTLLDVNLDERIIFIDVARDPSLNEQLLQVDDLLLTAHIDRVPVQIPAVNLQLARDSQGDFFYCAIPSSIRRLQRRNSFRVDVPKIPPAQCTVHYKENNEKLIIDNISATGIALTTRDLALPIERSFFLQKSVLELPQTEPFTVDLFVVRTQTIQKNQREIKLLGCTFQNLEPQTERHLQNYIFTLQRIEAAKNRWDL